MSEEGAWCEAETPIFGEQHRSPDKSPKKAQSMKRCKKHPDNLIFGVGVSMDQAKTYSEIVLVGRS